VIRDVRRHRQARLLAVGRKQTTIARLISVLQDSGAMPDTVVVAAPAADAETSQHLAPFAGAAIGKRFSLTAGCSLNSAVP
jgi:F0F1-type ATP synthase alpha subunit